MAPAIEPTTAAGLAKATAAAGPQGGDGGSVDGSGRPAAPESLVCVVEAAACSDPSDASTASSCLSETEEEEWEECLEATAQEQQQQLQQQGARQPPGSTSSLAASGARPGSSSQASGSSSDVSWHPGWQPSRAQVAGAASAPLLVAPHQGLPYQRILGGGDPLELPVNTSRPVEFETPLFKGRACIFVRGLPSSPEATFAGRRRRTLIAVQGQFQGPALLDDIVTGQEFSRTENLPPAWLVEGLLMRVARTLSPSMEIGPLSAPSLLMPVVSGCAEICVSRPGQEPHPAAPPREDMRLFDAALTAADGSPLPVRQRKAYFNSAANRAGRCFPADLVYTFYFYQHVVDASQYQLDVMYKFDLSKYLCGQPLQLMMRQRSSGQYLFCFHMWHEKLLQSKRTT